MIGIIFLLSWFGLLGLGIYEFFTSSEALDYIVPFWLFVFWGMVIKLI